VFRTNEELSAYLSGLRIAEIRTRLSKLIFEVSDGDAVTEIELKLSRTVKTRELDEFGDPVFKQECVLQQTFTFGAMKGGQASPVATTRYGDPNVYFKSKPGLLITALGGGMKCD